MYNELITKPFISNTIFNQFISEKDIINIMDNFYRNYAFSTFPYKQKLNSIESYKQKFSGNCIALSYAIQNILKSRKIKSFLIPASIPNIYKVNGYLELAHVALAVPIKENKNNYIYIVDTAFYFLNPLKIRIDNYDPSIANSVVFSKAIYDKEHNHDLKDYNSISKILSYTDKLKENTEFNEWQQLSEGIFYVKCHYLNNIYDTWSYYLTEIVNPDEAISEFFLTIKKEPFICVTEPDHNGICKCKYYIKKLESGKYNIKEDLITQSYDKIPINILKILKLYNYF